MMIGNDLTIALPEIFLVLWAMLLLMIGVFRGNQSTRFVLGISAAVLVVTLLLVVGNPAGGGESAFAGLFLADGFARFMKCLVLLAAAVTLVMSLRFIEREGMNRFEYPILVLFASLGMMMMVSAGDLLSLYLGLELQSLSLYVMAAFRRDELRASEAGLKYFVLGALSSGMLLYGCSMVYGFTGTTSFESLAPVLSAAIAGEGISTGLVVGLVFLSAGLAFKISAVPFHMWTPDVYEGAPTPVTAFFATAPKVAAMALFVRVLMGPFGDMVDQWQQIVVFISIASMVLGALAAISQTNIKRLMAYSSIGHVGYALVGLAAGTEEGVRGIAVYLAIYIVMNLGTFACILSMRRDGIMVEGIEDLKGLAKSNPAMALVLGIFMFSMAGIPPLAGFFGKYFVFLAAINAGLYLLAVIGVLASVIGAFYYLRIVKFMYFDESEERFDQPVGHEIRLVMGFAAIIIVFFIAFPNPVVDSAAAAAAALVSG